MKTIQPTPSQAAVVLKTYLQELGFDLKLSQAQEAIARVHGYASWNVLAAAIPVRKPKAVKQLSTPVCKTCQRCKCALNGDYCSNNDCCYADWPQIVTYEDLKVFADEEVEDRYKVRKRQQATQTAVLRPLPLRPLTLSYFMEQSHQVGPENIDDFRTLITRELLNTGLLNSWRQHAARGECMYEGTAAGPLIQVSFDHRLSTRFTTELVFTLRDHQMQCHVRTWELRDELDPSRDYGIFDERSGAFDTDVVQPQECDLSSLISAAIVEADRHKTQLIERFSAK